MASKKSPQNFLVKLLLSVDNHEDMEKLLGEILSPAEIARASQRILTTKALLEGRTYREIEKQLGSSTYVIYRAKRSIVNAKSGIIKRLLRSFDGQTKEE